MIKAFQNQKMSADVLEETNLDQKNEEDSIEFKKDSKLKDFLFLKSGNKEDSFTFKQVSLLLFNLKINILFFRF